MIVLVTITTRRSGVDHDGTATCPRCEHKAESCSRTARGARKITLSELARTCPRRGEEMNLYLENEVPTGATIEIEGRDGRRYPGFFVRGELSGTFGPPAQTCRITLRWSVASNRRKDEPCRGVVRLAERIRKAGYKDVVVLKVGARGPTSKARKQKVG